MSVAFTPATFAPIDSVLVEKYGYAAGTMVVAMREDLGAVHMHSEGAGRCLEVLGFEPGDEGWVGECAPEDFLGRVLVALAVAPQDEGCPSYLISPEDMNEEQRRVHMLDESSGGTFPGIAEMRERVGLSGGRMWHGSRDFGDLQRRLGQLRDLAEFCVERGMLVAWA